MANQHAAPVTAAQVGSYFVQQYYQVFQQQRDYVHQFYTDSSSMIRVDGEISASASDMVEKGYFVLNDMFHFADEEVPHQTSVAQEQNVDCQPTISSHLPDPPVADYPLEEAARNYVNSFHIDGGEPVQEYSYQEPEPEPEPELETDQLDPEPEIEPVAEAVVGRLAEETY
ncbi:UNVERIFIED_CONTAM: hypothetical protein Sradi_1385100 [Sesamum radiatum]|uniref:NTF2 domain-containing protein n=1 Tax=Sesamum radiatum TaxID=300843 RepID=A0AAW2UUJ5_SESRA